MNAEMKRKHRLDSAVFATLGRRRFRGTIADYARTVTLGASYEVPETNLCENCRAKGITHCRHFEVSTAKQLWGVLEAIKDPNVRKVMLLKAVQTLGSLAYDMSLHWFVVHSDYKTMIIFLDNDDKAESYADKRLLPTLRANADVAPLLPTGAKRHGDTKTEIKLTNGKIICVCGLNESNASSLTWQVVIIDEGWLHASDGLMQKAIDRAKQVKNRKVIIVGQAGKADEDQDNVWKGLNKQVPLTWACPKCAGRQEFKIGPDACRPDDFVPIPVEGLEPPIPDSYYGLNVKRRFDDIVSDAEIQEVADTATYQCFHCGFEIADTREMRWKMMDTYEQGYQETDDNGVFFTPANYEVGFWNPDPASVTIPFSQTMREFIRARIALNRFGDKQPYRDFWMNRWATAWSERLVARQPRIITGSGVIDGAIPDELARVMFVDCQQDDALTAATGRSTMGHYWYVARAIDRFGNMFQLARGYATSEAEWQAVQSSLAITNDNVGIDGGNWRNDVIDLAAKNISKYTAQTKRHGRIKEMSVWLTYKVLCGRDGGPYKWPDGRWRSVKQPVEEYRTVTIKEKELAVQVPVYDWSNLLIKDQLATIFQGGEGRVKFVCLPANKLNEQTQRKEVGNYTYAAQMVAEERTFKKDGRTPIYEKTSSSAQNHYADCECGCLVLFGLGGFLGIAAPES